MKPRLLAIAGSLTDTVRHLVDGQISIGRDEANQLCLNRFRGLAQALHNPAGGRSHMNSSISTATTAPS